jgi:hypothetical protein
MGPIGYVYGMFSLLPRVTLLAVLAFTVSAPAAILVNDGFELATHPTGSRTQKAGLGAAVYTVYSSSITSANIQNDAAFGSSALVVSDLLADGNNSPIIIPFNYGGEPARLNQVTESIEVRLSFRYIGSATTPDYPYQFLLGLYDDDNSPVTADNQSINGSIDDQGYFVRIGESSATPNNEVFARESGGSPPILAGGDNVNFLTSSPGFSISDDAVHTAVFSIRVTAANTLQLSLSIDGAPALTAEDSSMSQIRDFEELAISNASFTPQGINYAIDNVVVEHTFVPEPGVGALLAGGAALLCGRRRSARRP